MSFWRSWTASLVGASGAALAVPVGLLLTVVVAAAISGGGGFGGLVQLTRGPQIPGVTGAGPLAASPLDGGLLALPTTTGRARSSTSSGTTTAGTPRAMTGTTTNTTTTPTKTTTTQTTTSTPTTTAQPTTTATTPTTATATTAPSPTTTGTSRPNPLREGVRTVQGIVKTVPILGPPVSDAVGSVADLILPPLPRASDAAPRGPVVP